MAKAKKNKLKTHKGAAKRFKVQASGKIKHRCAFKNHILTKKSSKTIMKLRGLTEVCKSDEKAVQQMLAGQN